MCRAQFERDDILEADIMCHGHRLENSELLDPEAEELIGGHHQELTSDALNQAHPRTSALTWKLPAWVNFSYRTMNQRRPKVQHRRPNPFGPHKDKDLTEMPPSIKVNGTPNVRPTAGEGPSNGTKVTPDGFPWNVPSTSPDRAHQSTPDDPASGPVVKHPPSVPWDDQDVTDLPYDNPFYTRRIENVLWLPRNPAGILDLDDTVDLKVSIPVDASAGRLGTWLGIGETASPEEISPINEHDSGSETKSSPLTPRLPQPTTVPEVDGTEDIDLPLVIAKRVKAKEGDVEQTLRPRRSSVFTRKASGGSLGSPSIRPRLPSTFERPMPSSSHLSTGDGMRPRSASVAVPSFHSPIERTRTSDYRTTDQEIGIRPDAHAQADFIAANSSRISLPLPKLSRSQNVSAAQAIYHEVLEEEKYALQDRIEEETAEANRIQSTKSWLTSWLFQSRS